MNSGRLLFEGRGKGGGKERGRRAHHRVLNHGTLATLDRSPIEITAKLGVEQSRINQPVNYSAWRKYRWRIGGARGIDRSRHNPDR